MLVGTKFQIKVWNELKKIPRGEVRTYKEIAIAIGRPNSARAVANACGKNPRPIEIPCHRVIKYDGSLGGYSAKGGVSTKYKLLKKEGISSNILII
jgi:methylated-DNA-[protein]-cysteine S-methyltransferase